MNRITPWIAALAAWGMMSNVAFAQAYDPPRTATGVPDLQGNWITPWLTPLERPPGVTSLELSSAEADALFNRIWSNMRGQDPLSPLDTLDVAGLALVRGVPRSSLIVSTDDGKLPLRTAPRRSPPTAGLDSYEQRPPPERCLPPVNTQAPLFLMPAGNVRQIVQTPDHMVVMTEILSARRIIPLTPEAEAAPLGGRGHWEGDTLVVVSSGFAPNDRMRAGPFANFPISPQTTITERFTRISEAELLYSFTVADDGLYTAPWTAEMSLVPTTHQVLEWACHEGNYALTHVLEGARLPEWRDNPPWHASGDR